MMVGIVRYRDRYKPAKSYRQTLRGLPTGTLYKFDSGSCLDEALFPGELKQVIQSTGTQGT